MCQEQKKGTIQTGQLPASPSPRGGGRTVQLVCRKQQQSLRTNLFQQEILGFLTVPGYWSQPCTTFSNTESVQCTLPQSKEFKGRNPCCFHTQLYKRKIKALVRNANFSAKAGTSWEFHFFLIENAGFRLGFGSSR